uniref:Uncharacterized protein n=1 Tax=Globodera rostochiensis TaxID=31243 RepID=A0A914H911_GLORO
MRAYIVVKLGGRATEELVYGLSLGHHSDMRRWKAKARKIDKTGPEWRRLPTARRTRAEMDSSTLFIELLENFQRICRGLQSLVGPAVAVIGWTCDCNHWLDLRLQSLVGPVTAIISWTCSDDDDKTCECAAPLEKKGKISQMRSRSFFYPSKT